MEQVVLQDIITIGLTATPLTKGLGDIYEDVVNATATNDLLQDGYLAPIRVYSPQSLIDISNIKTTGSEWQREDLGRRVAQIVGDVIPEWERRTQEHFGTHRVPTLVFGASVADCEAICEAFQTAGHDFQTVHYRMSSAEKQAAIERFRRNEHTGLVSCVALTKGFDVPHAMCLVDCYPLRKSLSMHIQKLGRVMRTAPGKQFGIVIDHAGNWLAFQRETMAFFAAGCQSLNDRAPGDIKPRKAQDDEAVREHTCAECGLILEPQATECLGCGAARQRRRPHTTETVAGELGHAATIDGLVGSFNGDWWPEICTYASQIMHNDPERARRIAVGAYKGLFGQWPNRKYAPAANRPPNKIVVDAMDKSYRHYKARQNYTRRKQNKVNARPRDRSAAPRC